MKFPSIPMYEIRSRYNPGEYRHWFDEGALRFFDTVLPAVGLRTEWGNYFITRETNPSGQKRYSIRKQYLETGNIGTHGEFHVYPSYMSAKQALLQHLNEQCAEVA